MMSTLGSAVRSSAVRSDLRNQRRGESNPRAIAFMVVLWCFLFIAVAFLVTLVGVTLVEGWGRLDPTLVSANPSSRPNEAGAHPAIFGTLWVIGTTAILAIPLGVAAAVHLEELSNPLNRFNRLVEINVQNLAAVPSIVYGLLTLGFLTALGVQQKNVVFGGALALGLLILPVIIIATRESLRAVPREIRDGSLALGASPWQTVWRQVVPAAIPGIATGAIIALSRAIGEAAPLLVLGGLVYLRFVPDGLFSQFTTMPIQIFNWAGRPQADFHTLAAAASILLLGMLLLMNGLAIAIRNRYQKKW